VCQVWRQRGRTRETCHVLYRSLKARPSHFPVKLVTITNEFAIVIEVIRLSCDGLVIIAQSSLYLVTPFPFSSALQYSQPFLIISNSWLKINTVFKVTPGAWVEAINAFIWWQIKFILRGVDLLVCEVLNGLFNQTTHSPTSQAVHYASPVV